MGYMTSQEIIDKLESLDGDDLDKFVHDHLPTVKNVDRCQEVFEIIYRKLQSPWHYDKYQKKFENLITRLDKHFSGQIVMDLGSSFGHMWLNKTAAESVILADISETCIEAAKQLHNNSGNSIGFAVKNLVEPGLFDLDEDVKPTALLMINSLYYTPSASRAMFYKQVAELAPEIIATGANGCWRDYMQNFPEFICNGGKYHKFTNGFSGRYEEVDSFRIDDESGGIYEDLMDNSQINIKVWKLVRN